MNFTATRYHTTTADNGPAGRAVRYKDAAAATKGPAVRHVGVQTVAVHHRDIGVQTVSRATTLEPASPSPASSTTSLRNSASTEPTSVSARDTPAYDAFDSPKSRPSSPPAEQTAASSPAAPADWMPVTYPAVHANVPAAASRGPRRPSPAPHARHRSRVTAPHVQRISAPAHAKRQAKREAEDRERHDAVEESWLRAVDGTGVDMSMADVYEYAGSEPDLSPSPPTPSIHNAPPPPSAAGFRMVLTRRPATVLSGLISLYDGTEDAPVFGRRSGLGRLPLL